MKHPLRLLVVILFIAGCSKSPNTGVPTVIATLPSAQVYADAQRWAGTDPERYFVTVADTHSMEPLFTSKSLPLCIKYTNQVLPNGAVAIYKFSDALPHVIHRITAQNADSFYFSGDNNHGSDGWHPKKSVQGFVVGQLYLP